jgi:hypothetical protein
MTGARVYIARASWGAIIGVFAELEAAESAAGAVDFEAVVTEHVIR